MSLPAHRMVAPSREHDVPVREETILLQAALHTGIDGITPDCGGCTTCHLWVDHASQPPLPPSSAGEVVMLETEVDECMPFRGPGCRSVATSALDSLRVWLPAARY